MAQVIVLKLNKRNCPISIVLNPVGVDMLDVSMDICGKHFEFTASSAVGCQFGAFLSALYHLYRMTDDGEQGHFDPGRENIEINHPKYVRSRVSWDPEGGKTDFVLTVYYDPETAKYRKDDVICLTIDDLDTFEIEGRDLCYAVAKACTDVLKRCGIYGYYLSTGGNCSGYGDSFNIQRLLFVKAYALDVTEVRKPFEIWRDPEKPYYRTEATSFENEIELLLFDM